VTGFPLLLDLTGRRVLVVGGGAVAVRRARSLADAGAEVLLVAPQVSDPPAGVRIERRPFADADLDGAWLVVAATDDPAVNAEVAAGAETRRVFCVRSDEASGGTARVPAVAEKDGLIVAVNGGDDPLRAVALRNAIALALDLGELPARRHRRSDDRSASVARQGRGHVALVGGGPGDPELITVRGRRLVADADVLVVDRLAPRALLDELPDGVEVIDSGKAAHRHNLTQDQINDLLVARALEGKRVVRLKGGDPFVFGRGGEEWLACVAAGVPVTVVPGISSALAGAAAAGIPLTHRGVAADFTVVSGHLDPGRPASDVIDWPHFAPGKGTLVILMGMDRLGVIADELIKYGRPPQTPTAVVHRATMAGQRVVRARLDAIAEAAVAAGIGAPSIVVVGDVVDVLGDVAPLA